MDAKTKSIRYSREVESLLKQFQKYANMGPAETFKRRYAFTFWPAEMQKYALALMEAGEDFDSAFAKTVEMYQGEGE